MIREDIYKYFILESQLYTSLMSWVQNIRINTEYANLPYQIKTIANGNGGVILLTVIYKVGDDHHDKEVSYTVPIDDLARY